MICKTLHWYILREMLRIFLLTASALTTLMAFGGTFQPLVKQGIDVSQLMTVMAYLMPAMLAYAIPISALFAAVLVYWRMSTDNELTACRAGGISFAVMVIPAFILGLAVASTDLVFVNYVVPRALQSAERAVIRDLGSILVTQVGRGEYFDYDRLIVYANQAEQKPGGKPGEAIVTLDGVAGAYLGADGKPSRIVVARQATLTIDDLPASDSAEINVQATDAAAYDPKSFLKISGSTSFAPEGHKLIVPSQLKTKPKFLNLRQLTDLHDDPYKFPPVAKAVNRISQVLRFEDIAEHVLAAWSAAGPDKPLNFGVQSVSDLAGGESLRIFAPLAQIVKGQVLFSGRPSHPVRVEQLRKGSPVSTYTCDAADLQLTSDDFLSTTVTGILQLRGQVMRRDLRLPIGANPTGTTLLPGLVIPPAMYADAAGRSPFQIVSLAKAEAKADPNSPIVAPLKDALDNIQQLFQYIRSELNSRGSFALACLTLVLLGAALGILMRGKNPLAVFVVGFVPAIVLVLLITAGRQLTEGDPRNTVIGVTTIWLGNFVLLVMVSFVYGRLFRQ